ncbi:MAG: segregation/condensation protein A [Bacteroidetes bacterium]|nr:segregation/condensation protein A [Bacteroidota bacterium]
MGGFKIRIPDFEGPLDLLLFFIRRDELDIYNIPIAYITQEFLSYIRVMQMLDLELAGEFIVMAATLMHVKVRMLLPRTETEEGEEEIDPRAELTQRLLEYKRFKESAEELQKLELDQRERYFRSLFKYDVKKAAVTEDEDLLEDVTMFQLIKAFQRAMTNIPKKVVHEVRAVPWSIEEQGAWLMKRFDDRARFNFIEIMREMKEKMQVVITFIALLELIRAHRVRVEVYGQFNDIDIIRRDAPTPEIPTGENAPTIAADSEAETPAVTETTIQPDDDPHSASDERSTDQDNAERDEFHTA